MLLNIRRKRWRLVFRRLAEINGYCDKPTLKDKAIVIDPRIKTNSQKYMETLLHEMLHAAAWDLDEELVAEYAYDAARELHRLGFSRDK